MLRRRRSLSRDSDEGGGGDFPSEGLEEECGGGQDDDDEDDDDRRRFGWTRTTRVVDRGAAANTGERREGGKFELNHNMSISQGFLSLVMEVCSHVLHLPPSHFFAKKEDVESEYCKLRMKQIRNYL